MWFDITNLCALAYSTEYYFQLDGIIEVYETCKAIWPFKKVDFSCGSAIPLVVGACTNTKKLSGQTSMEILSNLGYILH